MSEQAALQGRVEQLLPGGAALVRTAGCVVLVADGVPGETVSLERTGKRRGAERARITGCIEPSPSRVQAPCPVAGKCGGCALQCLDASMHSKVKSDWVFNQLGKYLDAGGEIFPVQEAPAFGMRRRARWHRGEDDRGSFLGFHARSSHARVRAPECAVVHPDMDAFRLAIESILPPVVASVRMLRLSDGMHVVFECAEGADITSADDFAACLEQVETTALPIQPWVRAGVVIRPLIKPALELHDRLPSGDGWVELAVGPEDFVQGHELGNTAILRQIQAWAGSAEKSRPRRIADLFCGIGNLSLPLAAAFGAEVVGADVAESSIRAARSNAKRLGLRADFEALNLFDGLDSEAYVGADVMLLDPPRKGAKAICRDIGRLLPDKIIMVNCDIAAGARDAETLQANGYRMTALRALDIFPFSGHVEAMSLWTR